MKRSKAHNVHRPQIEARKRLLIAGRDVRVRHRTGAGDDPADQPAHGCCFIHYSYRSCVERGAGQIEIALKPSCERLLG